MADGDPNNLTQLTVDLLGAYVANNQVQHGDLAQLIQSTHAALKGIESPEPATPEEPEHKPAVSLRKSLGSKTHIISMIDGKSYQTLKRHLAKHDLTPDQYRERYGLPKSYPMVAPAYSEARRAIAEKLGLGRKVKGAQDGAPAQKPAKAETAPASKRAGRPPKAAAAAATVAETKQAKPAKPSPAVAKKAPSALAKPRAAKATPAKGGAPITAAASTAPVAGAAKPKRVPAKKMPAAAKA
jgi:predicted transcriptional regulator